MSYIDKPCECPLSGFCNRHNRTMQPGEHERCQNNEAYRRLFNELWVEGKCEEYNDADTEKSKIIIPTKNIVVPKNAKRPCTRCGKNKGVNAEERKAALMSGVDIRQIDIRRQGLPPRRGCVGCNKKS